MNIDMMKHNFVEATRWVNTHIPEEAKEPYCPHFGFYCENAYTAKCEKCDDAFELFMDTEYPF